MYFMQDFQLEAKLPAFKLCNTLMNGLCGFNASFASRCLHNKLVTF